MVDIQLDEDQGLMERIRVNEFGTYEKDGEKYCLDISDRVSAPSIEEALTFNVYESEEEAISSLGISLIPQSTIE